MSKKRNLWSIVRSEILHQIYGLCEYSLKEDYESALKVLSKKSKLSQENEKDLLKNIVNVLQSSRLTVNFDFSKLYDISSKSPEVLNCFAYREKLNEIPNYNVGRANIEELVDHVMRY